ncbi:PREDICTED: tRNA-splicing endonuclease subunit Sen54-like [Branchiostoma belcheri]|uniref:tRNA-splicing endonuclease subunit Sen54-like n=1 Tax=Branchiostoma belcheri TaxID=7741 RepID=A0A6P5AHA4_BRABE|nr:PREDICTED: tRNA-splicing endonuclease subunit Sen54-like [Branchiostoma belcheri]
MESADIAEEEDRSSPVKAARLSAQELLAHRNLDRTVPPRGGTKDYAPDGSQEQEEKLQGMYSLYRRMLAEERVNKIGNLSTATWLEDLGLAEVTVDKGKFWHHMGHTDEGKKYLYPEEVVFLMEMNSIEVYWNKVPLAIQQAYAMMLGDKVSMEQYQVYAHLSRLGYILMRHQSREHFSWYERQIQLDEYIPLKERIKEGLSSQVRDWFPSNLKEEQASSGNLDKTEEVQNVHRNKLASQESEEEVKSASHSTVEHSTFNQMSDPRSEGEKSKMKGRSEQPVDDEQMEIDCENDRKDKNEKQEGLNSSVLVPHEYKWDFTNINIPNVGQDCNVSEIPAPSAELLPAGVQVNSILKINTGAFSLNTKKGSKRKSNSEHLSKIVPNLRAEDDPRKVSRNWVEYKELCGVKREVDMSDTAVAHLWEGDVTPLVRPSDATDMGTILSKLQVIQNISLEKECSSLPKPDRTLEIAYDVFLPDSHFKKSKPGRPNLRVCVQRFSDAAPELALIVQLNQLSSPVPLLWAVVDNGDISFYSFTEADLPTDYHM